MLTRRWLTILVGTALLASGCAHKFCGCGTTTTARPCCPPAGAVAVPAGVAAPVPVVPAEPAPVSSFRVPNGYH